MSLEDVKTLIEDILLKYSQRVYKSEISRFHIRTEYRPYSEFFNNYFVNIILSIPDVGTLLIFKSSRVISKTDLEKVEEYKFNCYMEIFENMMLGGISTAIKIIDKQNKFKGK